MREERIFCDICGKEITTDCEKYDLLLALHGHLHPGTVFARIDDMCVGCAKDISNYIASKK